jgi:hypothetical protein
MGSKDPSSSQREMTVASRDDERLTKFTTKNGNANQWRGNGQIAQAASCDAALPEARGRVLSRDRHKNVKRHSRHPLNVKRGGFESRA